MDIIEDFGCFLKYFSFENILRYQNDLKTVKQINLKQKKI
jgi:hypothetical protein